MYIRMLNLLANAANFNFNGTIDLLKDTTQNAKTAKLTKRR